MKNVLLLIFAFCSPFFLAQNVIFNKVETTHTNSDKFLYKVNPEVTKTTYLGQIEVQGYSNNDVEMFSKIYQKAKEIGANSFALQPFEAIEGGAAAFDPAHYRLDLFYTDSKTFEKEDNTVYLISSPNKAQKISFNDENIFFEPRTFTKRQLVSGTVYTVSTRKFLGTSIRLAAKDAQPVQYFQISAFSVNSNTNGEPGLNLKSGDIVRLEQSYAQFLTTVYREIK